MNMQRFSYSGYICHWQNLYTRGCTVSVDWTTVAELILQCYLQAFNNTRHDFEIQLENASVVQPCDDEPEDAIPNALYHVCLLLLSEIGCMCCVVLMCVLRQCMHQQQACSTAAFRADSKYVVFI